MSSDVVSYPLTVLEAIVHRRTARRFDPSRPLDECLLKRTLALATFAPSSHNLQPWRFLVVRDAADRQRLRAAAFNQPKVGEAPVVVVLLGYQTPDRSHLAPMLERMQALGAVTPEGAAELAGRAVASVGRMTVEDRAHWATRSTMLAAATLMLAAESLGVASALVDEFDPEKVRAALGVPDDHTVCCLVALGHPAEKRPFPGRFGLADVCYEEHFGQPWTLGEADGPALGAARD